jgi:hypothetical protein
MSAKACRLCGKSLGRIRVGTDGDFCSHEHRNQYRLRQGMDRLMEANTVANLMRRRERPKSIVPKQVNCASSLERRSFAQGPPMPVRAGMLIRHPGMSISGGSGLGHIRRMQTALVRFRVLGTQDARHRMFFWRRRSQKLFLLPRSQQGGISVSGRTAAPARQISPSALRGVMLRVSGSAGFRLPRVAVPQVGPSPSTNTIRAGFKNPAGRSRTRPSATRADSEQWGALRTGLYVAEPRFAFRQPWSGLRPGPMDIPASSTAVPAIRLGPVTARMAHVRIDLRESMRYAISSEEDRS